MSKKELALTKESIANEGIEIKLTQSDVIDMLVEQQLDDILSIPKQITETYDNLLLLVDKEWEDHLRKVVDKIPVPAGLTVVGFAPSKSTQTNMYLLSLREYFDNRSNNISYRTNDRSISLSCNVEVKVRYEGEISGITVFGESESVSYKFKHSKKLIAMLESHNEKVKDFIKMVPEKGFNEKEIAKRIKNQFTKEILKTSSSDFRKKLKEGFAIDL